MFKNSHSRSIGLALVVLFQSCQLMVASTYEDGTEAEENCAVMANKEIACICFHFH